MKTAVIIFPGSNCDRDMVDALTANMGKAPIRVWHADRSLPKVDIIAIPGGFSYGDYLRSGAMAAHSPIMREVVDAANKGVKVLGVCNGFQILTEAGLLPGVLMRNRRLKFISKPVHLRVENADTVFTRNYNQGQVVRFPIAHHDGNYFADEDTLKRLEDEGSVAFRYANEKGEVSDDTNPNGSRHNIAGVFNKNKNVLGMMPHPERYADALNGGADGKAMFAFNG